MGEIGAPTHGLLFRLVGESSITLGSRKKGSQGDGILTYDGYRCRRATTLTKMQSYSTNQSFFSGNNPKQSV